MRIILRCLSDLHLAREGMPGLALDVCNPELGPLPMPSRKTPGQRSPAQGPRAGVSPHRLAKPGEPWTERGCRREAGCEPESARDHLQGGGSLSEASERVSLDKHKQAFPLKLFWEDFPCMYEMPSLLLEHVCTVQPLFV